MLQRHLAPTKKESQFDRYRATLSIAISGIKVWDLGRVVNVQVPEIHNRVSTC